MKKIFAFAIALVAMATSMVSCNNDNDVINDLDPANRPAANQEVKEEKPVEVYVDYLLPVTDAQLDMMDITITYTIDGESHSFTPADMTEISFPFIYDDTKGVGTPKCLSYRLKGSFTKKQLQEAIVERTVTRNELGMEKHKEDKINCFFDYGFCLTRTIDGESNMKCTFTCMQDVNLAGEGIADRVFDSYKRFGEPTHILN